MELVKLPIFKFTNKNITQNQINEVYESLKSSKKSLIEEIQITDKEKEQIECIKEAIYTFGTKFNLDLSNRLSREKIYFFNYSDFNKILEEFKLSQSVLGMLSDTGSIVLLKNDTANMMSSLNHELIHLSAYISLGVEKINDKKEIVMKRHGYAHYEKNEPKNYELFNEGLTELINLEIKRTEWNKYKPLRHLIKQSNKRIGYKPVVGNVKRIIDDLQEKIPDRDIKKLFIRNYFTGSTEPLELINKTYDKDVREKICDMINLCGLHPVYFD